MLKGLVIGYGNSLRSDDGIGIEVANVVAGWHLAGVKTLTQHQLTPELAAELAQVDLAIFVDACQAIGNNTVELYSLKPAQLTEFVSHHSDPRVLLGLTQALYGRCPQAWWVIVPGIDFQYSDRLSPLAQQGVDWALNLVKSLLSTNLISQDVAMSLQKLGSQQNKPIHQLTINH